MRNFPELNMNSASEFMKIEAICFDMQSLSAKRSKTLDFRENKII